MKAYRIDHFGSVDGVVLGSCSTRCSWVGAA